MESIKELKDVLNGMNKVSLLLVKHFKDGVQVKDALEVVMEILSNDELKKAMVDAAEGISNVPAEIKDLDAAEIVELVVMEAQAIPEIIAALKA